MIIYGIPNCDTTKKAMAWLTKNKLVYNFHDYKIQGISKARLEEWIKTTGKQRSFFFCDADRFVRNFYL